MPTGSTVFLVFTGVVTFAVLVQTVVLVAMIVGAKAAQRKIMEQVEKLHDELHPVLNAATDLMALADDMTPRLRAITVTFKLPATACGSRSTTSMAWWQISPEKRITRLLASTAW